MNYDMVCGFALNGPMDAVVLIEKNRPDWMAGHLNGIGGHIEDEDYGSQLPHQIENEHDLQRAHDLAALAAMRREYGEETGCYIHDWKHFATLTGDKRIAFFIGVGDIAKVHTTTDEEVGVYGINSVLLSSKPLVSNVRWLLLLGLDSYLHESWEIKATIAYENKVIDQS